MPLGVFTETVKILSSLNNIFGYFPQHVCVCRCHIQTLRKPLLLFASCSKLQAAVIFVVVGFVIFPSFLEVRLPFPWITFYCHQVHTTAIYVSKYNPFFMVILLFLYYLFSSKRFRLLTFSVKLSYDITNSTLVISVQGTLVITSQIVITALYHCTVHSI